MPRIYLIGGAPRVGKSTLALKFIEHQPMPHVSTDAIRTSLRLTTTPEKAPDLFYLDSLNVDEAAMARQMLEHTEAVIAAADRESAVVWPAAVSFAKAKLAAGQDVLIEGIALLPALVAELDVPYTAVFIGNQSLDHAKIIHDYARYHPDTWLGGLQPATLDAFAHFVLATSSHIQIEAHRFHMSYLEFGDEEFPDSLKQAIKALRS
jgi:hypothetical protein